MPEVTPSKYLVQAGWDDVPHLTEKAKADMMASSQPHLIEARSTGAPSLGAGAIYPLATTEFVIAPFRMPDYWPRSYALDVGWKRTAAVWGARDPTEDVVYLYAEHYRGQAEPSIHATAIKARGEWIPGVIDPAARGRGQHDGERLMAMYVDLGLDLEKARNAVDAGIYEVWQRLSTGRLKVFSTLRNWLAEYRIYHRDEKGQIVKEYDHLMDATRYLIMSGLVRAIVKPAPQLLGESASIGDPIAGY